MKLVHSTVSHILDGLSDENLLQALRELKEFKKTGILEDGITRTFIKDIAEFYGESMSTWMILGERLILEKAAEKWYNLVTQ